MAQRLTDHSVLDADGFAFTGQLWVPASGAPNGRGSYPFYGVDGQTDGAGNGYAALAVAPHAPAVVAGNTAAWAAGTTSTVSFGLQPAPGAGVMQYLRQIIIAAGVGSALQNVGWVLVSANIDQIGSAGGYFAIKTTDAVFQVWTLPDPIPASAAGTQIRMQLTFPAASTGIVQATMIGFNRQV